MEDSRQLTVTDVLVYAIVETWDDAHRSLPLWATQGLRHQHQEVVWDQVEKLEAEQRHAEAQSLSAGHRPQPPQPLPSLYAETGRLPPGQLSLSFYPISLRQSAGPGLFSQFESRGPRGYGEEGDYSPHRPSEYKAAFDKHFQTNGYQDALQAVGFASDLRTRYTKVGD